MPACAPSYIFNRSTRRRLFEVALVLASALLPSGRADATVTLTSEGFSGTSTLTLRVGSSGSIDIVTFNVTGTNIAPTPTPVVGTTNGPVTSPAGGTEIAITADVPLFLSSATVTLTANSSAGLTCLSGGCGTTVIPFSSISWVSSNLATGGNAGEDIQSGTFNGSATQTLASIPVAFAILAQTNVVMSNVLTFTYANSTLYPSGQYRGRVVFTASVL